MIRLKLNFFSIILTFFCFQIIIAQDMQEGFEFLEKGEFSNAESFFENI